MRIQRALLLATWITISLLAIAAFASFSTENPSTTVVAVPNDAGSAAGFAAGAQLVGMGLPIETPSAPTTTAPASTSPGGFLQRSSFLTERQVRGFIARYFEPTDLDHAVSVAWCESSFNAASVDVRTGGSGLFHLPPDRWSQMSEAAGWARADIFDPEANVAIAAWWVSTDPGSWDVFACTGN